MFKASVLFLGIVLGAYANAAGFTFACHHDGTGNGAVGGKVLLSPMIGFEEISYGGNEGDSPDTEYDYPIAVTKFFADKNNLLLEGFFYEGLRQTKVSLNLFGDLKANANIAGTMTLGERTFENEAMGCGFTFEQ